MDRLLVGKLLGMISASLASCSFGTHQGSTATEVDKGVKPPPKLGQTQSGSQGVVDLCLVQKGH